MRPHHPAPDGQKGLAVLSIVLIYALFASLWIFFSDQAVNWLFGNPEKVLLASTLKGLAFVAITSMLLFIMMHRLGHEKLHKGILRPGTPFILLTLGIIGLTGSIIAVTINEHRKTEILRLQNIADLKVQQITDWLAERSADAEMIQNDTGLLDAVARWQQKANRENSQRIQAVLDSPQHSHSYYALSLISADGKSTRRSTNAPETLAQEILAAIPEALNAQHITRVGPYRDDSDRVRLGYVIPLHTGQKASPVVILHVDPGAKLFPLVQSWPVPSSSGETAIFRRDGDYVLFLNQLRHREETAAKMRLPIASNRFLAAQALRENSPSGTVLEGIDYLNNASIGVLKKIEGSDWLLITKESRREIMYAAYRNAFWIALAGLLAIFGSAVVATLLRQRQQLIIAEGIQHAQRERLQALNLLSAIAERTSDAIFAKDLAGRYIFCNRAAEEFSQASPGSIVGHDDHLLFPDMQADKIMHIDQETISSGHWRRYQETIHRPDSDITVEVTKGPLHDQHGNVIGVFGIARDITESIQRENALRESEARFHTVFDNAAVAIFVHHPETGAIIDANRRAIESFGFTNLAELQANAFWAASPYSFADALKRIHDTAAHGVQRFEWMNHDRHGEVFWTDVLLDRIELNGEMRVIAITTDITERKAMEDALRRQASELAERNQELERFNRATVGRELDMIALKQKVNALSEELGRPPPFSLDFIDKELSPREKQA